MFTFIANIVTAGWLYSWRPAAIKVRASSGALSGTVLERMLIFKNDDGSEQW